MKAPLSAKRSGPYGGGFTRKKAPIAIGCEGIIDAIDPGF
jgi:hypothetical protein